MVFFFENFKSSWWCKFFLADIGIEFSRDFGNTWEVLQPPCLPSDVDCGRFYPGTTLVSDVHTGWHRITVPLPYYSR